MESRDSESGPRIPLALHPGMWNGQEAAFRFYMAILGVLIYVNQPEPD